MPHSSKETLSIGWCDNGMTDGKFTEGLLYTSLTSAKHGIFINNAIRVQGNQIARQRMDLLELWADHVGTDWLLWVDSDVVLTADILKKLWDTADKMTRPVVTGVYFVSKAMEGTLMTPMPALFLDHPEDEYLMNFIHPLPYNEVIPVDSAGMGLVLMHKSIVPVLRKKFPDQSFFAEKDLEKIKSSTEHLNAVFSAASQDMYNAANAGGADASQAGGAGQGSADSEVTDVDFEEVKDEKK